MPVGAAIGGAAVVGGVATSKAAKKNAQAAQSVADQNNALQREIYNENRAAMQPYAEGGARSFATWQDLMGLSANPEEASRRGYEAYKSSLGYDEGLTEGNRALNALAGSKGMLGSGAAAKDAIRFGQNYANTFTGGYLDRLQGGTQVGVSATNALSGASTAFGNSITANNNNALTAQMASTTAQAGAINGIAGNLAGALAYGSGNNWGRQNSLLSSYAKPGGATPVRGIFGGRFD